MKKTIIIEEKENGEVSLKASKGIKWNTFIISIEMLIEIIKEEVSLEIDDILEDIKRIYERDNKAEKDNKNN